MDERQRRVGLNEAIFREINERIEAISTEVGGLQSQLDFVCECGDARCSERISMSAEEYERLRSDPLQFALTPGHDDETVEVVIAHAKTYDVIRKRLGEPARLAEETDPR